MGCSHRHEHEAYDEVQENIHTLVIYFCISTGKYLLHFYLHYHQINIAQLRISS